MSGFALKNTLRRLAEKVGRANDIQRSGGRVDAEDWSELHQLVNEAFGVLDEHEDVAQAGAGAPPEYFAVLRMGDHTEVTGFDDEDEAEAFLESRLAQIDNTHEVYFEDVLPFRVFTSAEFAMTFKGYRDSFVGTRTVNTAAALLKKMRALTALDPSTALPLAALCQTYPGGVTRLATEKYYTHSTWMATARSSRTAFGIELRQCWMCGFRRLCIRDTVGRLHWPSPSALRMSRRLTWRVWSATAVCRN